MLNWSGFTPPATWKQNGREWCGSCAVTGEGNTKSWAVPDDDVIGCRRCGDPVSGKLTGAAFREHAAALGLVELNLGASGGHRELARWTFTTADRQPRDQIRRAGCGQPACGHCHGRQRWKHWEPVGDAGRGAGSLAPRCLLYLPTGELPTAPVIVLSEGASDADALHAIGLPAIGRPAAKSSTESLARFDSSVVYRIFPDHDDNGAGYRQALDWHDELTAAGLEVELIDPLKLCPDAPSGWDARDWVVSLPAGTTADAAGALLTAAVCDLDTLKARVQARDAQPATAPAVGALDPIPRQFVELCDSEEAVALLIAERCAQGRLRCVDEFGEWLMFRDDAGWRSVSVKTIEGALTDFARQSIGTRDKEGDIRMRPASSGRRSVGRGIAGLLAGRAEISTRSGAWDADPNIILMPNGDLLDVRTRERRRPTIKDLHRRRLPVEPADPDAFAASTFRKGCRASDPRLCRAAVPTAQARRGAYRRARTR